jgi:hypothetical protein
VAVDARKSPRSRVHLRVAYKLGDRHVEKFATNLSAGGLFVLDAEGLVPREDVLIEIELPKHGVFGVHATVMHLIPGDATRRAGAGLQLKSPPSVFATCLESYLRRLERRRTAQVFVDAEPWRALLADAGYRVMALPPAHSVVELLGDATAIAILAPIELAEQYRNALAFMGDDGSMVIAIDDLLPVEPVLTWLDDKLLGATDPAVSSPG